MTVSINDIITDTMKDYNLTIDRRLFPLVNRLLNEKGYMLDIKAVAERNCFHTRVVKLI